jgi:GTP-binding protein
MVHNNVMINILDTPGHADFSGEVERIMTMVDGVMLLVDAYEGVMPQTRFVLKKALEAKRVPIVVINKIDRMFADITGTENAIYDLFIDLGATIEQLDFPVLYASALKGLSNTKPILDPESGMEPLLDAVIEHIPAPEGDPEDRLVFQPALIDYNDYVGRMGIGKVHSGTLRTNDTVLCMRKDGTEIRFRIQKLIKTIGLERIGVETAAAGDIVAVAGLSDIMVGETVSDIDNPVRMPLIEIDPPTVRMTFLTNTSPFAGLEGTSVTASKLEERLVKETRKDVSLSVERAENDDAWVVYGRGELHLSILIENMRRENFEFAVSRPVEVTRLIDGVLHEPYEDVTVDCPEDAVGAVIDMLGMRYGTLVSMRQNRTYARLTYVMPSRGMIGLMTHFLTATKGYGVISHVFKEWRPVVHAPLSNRHNGALVQKSQGSATAYAIGRLEDRGIMFIEPKTSVYEGMIVGESNKEGDLVVNVSQGKELTNMRASSKDQTVVLRRPRRMNLEACLSFVNDDELVEITPLSIRLRKRHLDPNTRRKMEKRAV